MDDIHVLKNLCLLSEVKVAESITKNLVKPLGFPYVLWKESKDIEAVHEDGSVSYGRRPVRITKLSWNSAVRTILDLVRTSPEYESAITMLITSIDSKDLFNFPKDADELEQLDMANAFIPLYLDNLLEKLIYNYLVNPKFEEKDVDYLLETFVNELNGLPVKHQIKIELSNIILESEEIKVNELVSLRIPSEEDLEYEFPADVLMYNFKKRESASPSAILNIEFSHINDISMFQVRDAIKILKLFKVGDVECIHYETHSESIKDYDFKSSFSDIVCHYNLFSDQYFTIKSDEIVKLQNFWNLMVDQLYESFSHTFIRITYDHYKNALKTGPKWEPVSKERRIAEAIMGLEGLFLKGGERQELSYRLSLRAGKLISLLAVDKHEDAMDAIKDSYNEIRNKIVHGDVPKEKKIKKLEEKYESTDKLLYLILDYLRISILTFMIIRKDKEDFIDLIDESFINNERNKELEDMVSEIIEFI